MDWEQGAEEPVKVRLGDPVATNDESTRVHQEASSSGGLVRSSDHMGKETSLAKRLRTSCLRVANVSDANVAPTRTDESIVLSRRAHIKHLLETSAVKDWKREEALATGAKVLTERFVDDAHQEKSRWCAREFATTRDQSVFAAASDVDNTSLIDVLAMKRGHSILCFDAVAAFSQAPETELIFIEAPEEHKADAGDVLWQCFKVREGRRKGARAWQDHFVEKLLDTKCPGQFKQSLKTPTIFYSASFEIASG